MSDQPGGEEKEEEVGGVGGGEEMEGEGGEDEACGRSRSPVNQENTPPCSSSEK